MPVQTKKAPDLAERERALKAEEERLLVLRKEVDMKIAKYEKLLGQTEEKQKRKQEEKDAKVDQLVKLFEGMSAGRSGRAPCRSRRRDGRHDPWQDEEPEGQRGSVGHGSEAGRGHRPENRRQSEKFSRGVIFFLPASPRQRHFFFKFHNNQRVVLKWHGSCSNGGHGNDPPQLHPLRCFDGTGLRGTGRKGGVPGPGVLR